LSEDEVWNEYDDLLDAVLVPHAPQGPLPGLPHKASSYAQAYLAGDIGSTGASPTAHVDNVPSVLDQIKRLHTPSMYTVLSRRSSLAGGLTQHQSRLLSTLQGPNTPASTFTDLYDGYAERNLSVSDPSGNRDSFLSSHDMSSSRDSARSSKRRSSPPTSSLPTTPASDERSGLSRGYRDSHVLSVAESEEDAASMANLRFGALMTSKWLSFGRVLFSPAQLELKNANEDRVLILDGLGKGGSCGFHCIEDC